MESCELLLLWYDILDMAQAEEAYTSQPKKTPKAGKKKAEKTNYYHYMDSIYQNSTTKPSPKGQHGTA